MSNVRDSISSYFVHPALTPIAGKPSAETVDKLESELRTNAASVPAVQNGPNEVQNYVGLVLTDPQYNTLSPGNPFVFPAQPPAVPVHAAGAMGAQINENIRAHTELKKQHREAMET